jgi:PAS domain S-box-containing protein
MKILIVDDMEQNRYLLRALLEGSGCAVADARHGAEALAKARQSPPQMVISDLLMPVMDGYTLLRHWKADDRLKAIPFVVYTATYTEPRDERLALDLGADAFILKPTEPETFMARIHEVLAKTKGGELSPSQAHKGKEEALLKEYSEVLIRKLEEKTLLLTETNRLLQQEIIEHKRAEKTASRLAAIVESSDDAIIGKDLDGNIQSWNAGAEKIFGYSSAEMLGSPIARLIPAERLEEETRILEEIKRGENVRHFETVRLAKDGRRIDVSVTISPIKDSEGRIVGASKVARDITERKRAEERLRTSEKRFRLAAETANDLIYEWDLKQSLQWFGKIDEMLGYEPGEFPRTLDGWAAALHPEDLKPTMAAVRAHMEKRAPYAVEYRIRRKDGVYRWWAERGAASRTPDGKPVWWIGSVTDITERKRAEAALAESEEQFRATFEQAGVGIAQVGVDGRWLLVNQRLCDIVGYSPEELSFRTFHEITHPADLEKSVDHVRRLLAGEINTYTLEKRYIRKDRSIVPVNLTVSLVREAAGRPKHFIALFEDITDRKLAEAELLKTNRALQLISLFNQELVRATDEKALLQAACDLAVQKGGYRLAWVGFAEQDEAKSVRPVANSGVNDGYLDTANISWANTERGRGPTGTAIRTGRPVIVQDTSSNPAFEPWRQAALKRGFASSIALPLKDGDCCFGVLMLYSAEPAVLNSDETQLLGEMAGDLAYGIVSLRHRAERAKAEAEVERTAREWQATFDASNDAIWILDKDQRVLRSNKTAERHFRRSCADMLGRHCWTIVHGAAEPIPDCPFIRARKSGRRETMELHQGGRWFEVTVDPIRDAAGQPSGAVHIVSDITERKLAAEQILVLNAKLEERVAERTAQLQAANQELEAFSYSVSHDLRAPLRHIMGFVELLHQEAGPALSEKGRQHMTTIAQAAKRMGDLIDDLLAFSRVGRVELQKTDIPLDQLVQETLGDFEAETESRKIVWKVRPLPAVRADRALLRSVLVNLLSNAVKFTGARARPEIEIGCVPGADNETVVFIRDNGAGFDPRYAHKLFGVFQRLHNSTEFEGTGIGLANVQRIIGRHGGRTWAEGAVERGATFFFSIPK